MPTLEYEIKCTIYSPVTAPFRDKKLFPFELESAYTDFSPRCYMFPSQLRMWSF